MKSGFQFSILLPRIARYKGAGVISTSSRSLPTPSVPGSLNMIGISPAHSCLPDVSPLFFVDARVSRAACPSHPPRTGLPGPFVRDVLLSSIIAFTRTCSTRFYRYGSGSELTPTWTARKPRLLEFLPRFGPYTSRM